MDNDEFLADDMYVVSSISVICALVTFVPIGKDFVAQNDIGLSFYLGLFTTILFYIAQSIGRHKGSHNMSNVFFLRLAIVMVIFNGFYASRLNGESLFFLFNLPLFVTLETLAQSIEHNIIKDYYKDSLIVDKNIMFSASFVIFIMSNILGTELMFNVGLVFMSCGCLPFTGYLNTHRRMKEKINSEKTKKKSSP